MFSAKVLADSVNPVGCRLTTFELVYPRPIHSELLTHRKFSRNSGSSRAIPLDKMIANVINDPFIPEFMGMNQPGMQAAGEASPEIKVEARRLIENHMFDAIKLVENLRDLGLHKQVGNRYLEPWMFITVILSTTSMEHFRLLRCHPAAEPHFQKIAGLTVDAFNRSIPNELKVGEWHLPLLRAVDYDQFNLINELERVENLETLVKLSTGRCARVSYETHNGVRDPQKDVELHDSLLNNGHWSPFEHAGQAKDDAEYYGNFRGFLQHRKEYENEYIEDKLYFTYTIADKYGDMVQHTYKKDYRGKKEFFDQLVANQVPGIDEYYLN